MILVQASFAGRGAGAKRPAERMPGIECAPTPTPNSYVWYILC